MSKNVELSFSGTCAYKNQIKYNLERNDLILAGLLKNETLTYKEIIENIFYELEKECKDIFLDEKIDDIKSKKILYSNKFDKSDSCVSDSDIKMKSQSDDMMTDSITSDKKPNKNQCIECGALNCMVENETHCCIVCSKCGCQQETLLEDGPEWHQYNNDDNRGEGINRCGSITSYYFPKSSRGTIITGFNNSRLARKQKWAPSGDYKETALNKDFEKITRICTDNKIKKMVINTAKFLCKQISDCIHKTGKQIGKQVITRGNKRDGVICACVYKACETNKDPISKKKISKMFNITEKELSRGIKEFEKIIKNSDNIYVMEDIYDGTPDDYIMKYCSKLGIIDKKYIDCAILISNNCSKLKLATDHSAQSIGASIVLLISNWFMLGVDKKDIAYWFEISDVTITKIYNKLAPYMRALIDNEITDHLIEKFKING